MPQIDQLLESMARFGAQAALLTSGERVRSRVSDREPLRGADDLS